MRLAISYGLLIGALALFVWGLITLDSEDPGDFEPPRRSGHWKT